MKRKKRKMPGINGSALSDITFLFLTFFMLVSNMSSDTGLARRLPPPPQDDQNLQSIDVQRRNLLVVLVNSRNETMVRSMHSNELYINEDELLGKGSKVSLKDKVKEFVLNTNNLIDLPEVVEGDFGPPIGTVPVTSSHVVSLQNDATTSYWAYIAVQNELVRAYNELRQEAAQKYFGTAYDQLTNEQQTQINEMYPQRISEAEPKNYGGTINE